MTDFPTLPAPDLAALGEREKQFWASFESSGDQNKDATAFADWLMQQPESLRAHLDGGRSQLQVALEAAETARASFARYERGMQAKPEHRDVSRQLAGIVSQLTTLSAIVENYRA